ncbi:hypothetical protein DY000_02023802 [Brassica cretica]|uniref:Uncharacterized protein n=1 Tax=Brassica cretica TaxID=69181 RepID=A0ABQ7E4G0_BRACR|nr:hypothetical protein DY000_02023802 [Brassica cretica]
MHCSSNDHLYHLFRAPNAPKCLQELHVLERPYGVAAERRCKVALVPPSDENASDIGVSLWPSRSEGVSQRLRVVAPVRSLPCIARPMITFITSFELQMHSNVSKNSMSYSNT